ncbi:hypothetical protein [Natronorubrum sp. DTA7]|uniref:hypothetical protein n=1 Tax=Natronorubrum sp. DTA7 TaxID=3447016 RepID=UPI003F84F733
MSSKKNPSNDSSSDHFDASVQSFANASIHVLKGTTHAFWGFWEWVREKHPLIQAMIALPITGLLTQIASIFAETFYTTFWGREIIVGGTLHVSNLPVPVSVAIYFLLVITVVTMFSAHMNYREIERLKGEIDKDSED